MSGRPGAPFKGACLFLAGLRADTQDRTRNDGADVWVEIALKSRNISMTDVSRGGVGVLTFFLEALKALGDAVEVATKNKAAAELSLTMSRTNSVMKKRRWCCCC